jgi:N-acetylmuramoyl-L-alanine amidase
MHIVEGFPGIGYHFVIHWDGRVEYVNDVDTVTWHVGPDNPTAVGVCLCGLFTQHGPTDLQLASAQSVVAWLNNLYPDAELVPHSRLSATACPGAALISMWEALIP